MHFVSSDGFDIYVGKNNIQNDELTFKTGNGNDWWFHAKQMPGSHVLLKTDGKEVPDRTFEEAASLAAYYSKGREQEKVEVDYVLKKEVKSLPVLNRDSLCITPTTQWLQTPTLKILNSYKIMAESEFNHAVPQKSDFFGAPHNSAIFLLTGLTATHINASITDAQSATIHGIYWIASEDLPETIIIRITLITTFITNIPASFLISRSPLITRYISMYAAVMHMQKVTRYM